MAEQGPREQVTKEQRGTGVSGEARLDRQRLRTNHLTPGATLGASASLYIYLASFLSPSKLF